MPDSISSYTSISHDQSNPQQDGDRLLHEGASQLRQCLRRQEESDPVLKLWAKVSGVDKKNQADYVKYHAFKTVPAYFEELDAKFGDSLENKEDGLTDIINFLEQKFGVSQHSEIVRKLKDTADLRGQDFRGGHHPKRHRTAGGARDLDCLMWYRSINVLLL